MLHSCKSHLLYKPGSSSTVQQHAMKQEAMACNSMQQGSMPNQQLKRYCFSAKAIFTSDTPALQHQGDCYHSSQTVCNCSSSCVTLLNSKHQLHTQCGWPHAALAVCSDTISSRVAKSAASASSHLPRRCSDTGAVRWS